MNSINNQTIKISFIKNLIILSIIYALTAGSFPADSPRKTAPQTEKEKTSQTKPVPSKKTEKKSRLNSKKAASKNDKKSECCPVGRRFQSMVELEEICFRETSTEFRFRLLMNGAMCSVPDSIDLTDNIGNSYKVLRMDGIAECPSMTVDSLNKEFIWTFEKIQSSAEKLNLTEDRNAVAYTAGWVWWYWNDIEIKDCRRK